MATAGARTVVCRLRWLSEGGEGGAWGSSELSLVCAAVSRGAGEEVSKQFAASLAVRVPGNMCRAAIYQLAQRSLRAAPSGAAPAAERAPRGTGSRSGAEGGLLSPGSLNVIAFIGFGNRFYGLRCLLKYGRHGRGKEPQAAGRGRGAGLRCARPPGPRHSVGRDHRSWRQGAGMVCASGDPGIWWESQPGPSGPAPFVGWPPRSWLGMVKATPSS